jgi:hypothetical protein
MSVATSGAGPYRAISARAPASGAGRAGTKIRRASQFELDEAELDADADSVDDEAEDVDDEAGADADDVNDPLGDDSVEALDVEPLDVELDGEADVGGVVVGVSDGLGDVEVGGVLGEVEVGGVLGEVEVGGVLGLVGGVVGGRLLGRVVGVVGWLPFDGGGGALRSGPCVGPSTEPYTRVAWKRRVQRTGVRRTVRPVRGASTIMPLPAYMATWWMPSQLFVELKKSRSPGSSEYRSTTLLRVYQYWSLDTRGSGKLPAAGWWYAAYVRPEQSNVYGPSFDHSY